MQTEKEFYAQLDKDQDANLVEVADDRDITDTDRARLIKDRDISDVIESGNPARIEHLIKCYFNVLAGFELGNIDWIKTEIADQIIIGAYNIIFSDFQQEQRED